MREGFLRRCRNAINTLPIFSGKMELFAVFTIGVIGMLIYWLPFLNGFALGPGGWGVEVSTSYYSHLKYAADHYGTFPLFAPYRIGETYLFHLQAENPTYSPFNVLIPFLSVEHFIKTLVMLRLTVGFIGLLMLGSYWRINRWLVLVAFSVIYLSGYITGRLFNGHFMVFAVVWVPMLLYCFLRAMDEGRYVFVLLGGLTMSVLFIDGGNHVLIWSAYLLMIIAAIEAVSHRSLRPIVVVTGIGVFAMLFSAFKMLPAYIEYSHYTPSFLHGYMGDELYKALFEHTIAWHYMRAFPGDAHDVAWWEMYAYIGKVPAILAILSFPLLILKKFRGKYSFHMLIAAAFFVWITIGINIRPINELRVPGLMYERHTTRMLILAIMMVTLCVVTVISRTMERFRLKPAIIAGVAIVFFIFSIYDYRHKNASWMDYSRHELPPYHYLTYEELPEVHSKTYGYWDVVRLVGPRSVPLKTITPKADGVVVKVEPLTSLGTGHDGLQFSGDGKGFVVSGSSDLFPAEALSYSAWIKPAALPPGKAQAIVIAGGDRRAGLFIDASGLIHFSIPGLTGETAASASLADASWHHIAGVFDGRSAALYIDGAIVQQKDYSGAVNYGAGERELYIGGDRRGEMASYNGSLDQVALWGTALTSGEVKQLFLQGKTSETPLPQLRHLRGLWNEQGLIPDNFRVFNHKDSHVLIPRSPSMDTIGQGAFSVLTWVNSPATDPPSYGILLSNCCDIPAFTTQIGYGGYGAIRFLINSGKSWNELFGLKLWLNDGLWHMIAVVRDSNGDASIFEDGKLDKKIPFPLGKEPISFTKNDWRIGQDARMELDNGGFGGKMDVMAVWNKALSAQEISRIFDSGRSVDLKQDYAEQLAGLWKMGDRQGYPVLSDHSGNGNNGQLINLPEDSVRDNSMIYDTVGGHAAFLEPDTAKELNHKLVFRSLKYEYLPLRYLTVNVGKLVNYKGMVVLELPLGFHGEVRLQYHNPYYQVGKVITGISLLLGFLFLIPAVRRRIPIISMRLR